MSHDMITDPNLDNAPDTQLEQFPTIGDDQLEELLSDVNAILSDMPELSSASTDATVLPQRRRNRAAEKEAKLYRNAKRFYRGYFIGVGVLICALLIAMIPLRNWLERFESTQPDNYSQHLYETLFAQPDWATLYEMSDIAKVGFDSQDAYVLYMQDKVDSAENKQLSFYETSAGLSADHKYIVELDGKKIATFKLVGSVNSKTNKTEWEMTDLQLMVERNHSITIQRQPGQTILLNGTAVSDDYIVRNISTKAEEYLPEGIHGFALQELYVDDLMATPTVEVLDADGNAVPTTYDEETNTYTLDPSAVSSMTEAEKSIILNAAKANALFAIRAISTGELSKYFDPSTQIYKDICSTPTFIQSFASYNFNESVTAVNDFYRYSDDLFSARVTLQLYVTRANGSVKSLDMNTTYFFTKNAAGTFMVTNITNVNLQEQTQQVRLRFECNDSTLTSIFVSEADKTIALPQPDVLPGQVFLGWATKTVEENGQVTMTIIYEPGDGGQIPSDFTLEPMTLYAVFEAEEAVQ